jgi:hypothetical protein
VDKGKNFRICLKARIFLLIFNALLAFNRSFFLRDFTFVPKLLLKQQ